MTNQTPSSKSPLTTSKLMGWARVNRQAVLNMVAARIHAARERARVDAYIEPLFQSKRFINPEDGKLLTRSKDAYLSQDEEAMAEFYAECDTAHRAHGFTGPAEYCPALVAENAMIQAENVVLGSAERLLGVEVHSLEHRAQLLDLVVAMVEGK